LRHAPAPSHVPSSPHVVASAGAHVAAARGFMPADTNVHVPMAVGAEHVLHVSVQAVLQQTPSTQKLLVHSELQPQAWPSSFCPRASAGHFPSPPWPPPSRASSGTKTLILVSPPSVRCGFDREPQPDANAEASIASATTTHARARVTSPPFPPPMASFIDTA
jgi:hypothetical protein